MRILVTGSRDWRDFETILDALIAWGSSSPFGELTVVHGAATGADHMARSAALSLGYTEEPHFPDYAMYAPSDAPKKRNQHMVDLGADRCLAFPTKASRGTWHCVGLAEAADIPVSVYEAER